MKLDKLANGKSALGLTLKAEAGVEVKIELSPNEDSGIISTNATSALS